MVVTNILFLGRGKYYLEKQPLWYDCNKKIICDYHHKMLAVMRDNIVIMFLDEFSHSLYSYRYKYQLFSYSRPLVY